MTAVKKSKNKKSSKHKGLSELDNEYGVEYWSRQDVDELVTELGIGERYRSTSIGEQVLNSYYERF
jgi:hypothetical protein